MLVQSSKASQGATQHGLTQMRINRIMVAHFFSPHSRTMTKTQFAVAAMMLVSAARIAHADDTRERMQQLEQQVRAQQAQLDALAAQQETAVAPAATSLFGYGEISYLIPRDRSATQADLARAVFGIGHRYDERTHFDSEFEIEHAIASAGDAGEFEVEQFYIDHNFHPGVNLKAGLFLIPSGFLNERHEPPRYFGVERNHVETAIIPTTWREGGVGVYGNTSRGLTWDVGVTTGFDLTKWDAASDEGRESPLGAIHQELSLAKARDLSTYLALGYQGVPGLALGASVFTGGAGHDQPGIADVRVTLWEAHARWQAGSAMISALYAQGHISHTDALNASFAGEPTPVPQRFYGWYLEPSYRVWQSGGSSLTPFVRLERYNTAADYDATTRGLGYAPAPTEQALTYGVSYYLNPSVVFKADYQDLTQDDAGDRYGLGLGLMF